jgi:voltage-gated potassium channel
MTVMNSWYDFAKFGRGHGEFPQPNGGGPFAQRLYRVLHGHDPTDGLTRALDRGVGILVVLTVFLDIFLDGHVGAGEIHWLVFALDWASTIVLTVEFVAKIFLIRLDPRLAHVNMRALRFLLRPISLLDILILLPSWMTLLFAFDLGAMRLIRLLRLLELSHAVVPKWQAFLRDTENTSMRRRIFIAMFGSVRGFGIPALVDFLIFAAIIASIVFMTLESVASLREIYQAEFNILDIAVTIIFLFEYFARLYCCVEDPRYSRPILGRLRYAITLSALIDLAAALPFFMGLLWPTDVHSLWVLRLFRLLKLARYSKSVATIIEVVREERTILAAALLMLGLVTMLAACGIYVAENPSQPDKFSSIPASMYWAIVTLTTIGYGDFYPVTPIGQFLTMMLAVAGLCMIALPAGILATGFAQKLNSVAQVPNFVKHYGVADRDGSASEVLVLAKATFPTPINSNDVLPQIRSMDQVLRSPSARGRLTAIIEPLNRAEREALLALVALSLDYPTED